MEQIKVLCDKIKMPSKVCEAVFPVIEKIQSTYENELLEIIANFRNRELTEALAEKLSEDLDLTTLAVTLAKANSMHSEYKARGLSDDIYYASMRQIRIWTQTCINNYSKIGLRNWAWPNVFFEFRAVSLGRLDYMPQVIVPGKIKLNVHIPEDGPLCHEEVMKSYKMAYEHFGCEGMQIFACESWLLYPGNYEFLPENSNIRHFMNDYHIIEQKKTKDSGDLWRIFGVQESYSPEKLPRDTTLRKLLADYLIENDGEYGEGLGVFLYDGEMIY